MKDLGKTDEETKVKMEETRMEKYFEVKPGCELYEDYFAYKRDEKEIVAAYNAVCEKFGIETNGLYLRKDRFSISPTKNDLDKFGSMMKKDSCGEFKKNSEVSKTWVELVKDIKHFEKPKLCFYFNFQGYRWRERLFHVGDKLYCSIESEKVCTPDFATEMRASEFYMILEEKNGVGQADGENRAD